MGFVARGNKPNVKNVRRDALAGAADLGIQETAPRTHEGLVDVGLARAARAHLVVHVELPDAGDATGVMMMVKKIDSSKNVVTITEDSGPGPDGSSFFLGAENDYVMMLSNGAEWFVIASNRSPGNTRFFDGTGTYDIDMAVDTYCLLYTSPSPRDRTRSRMPSSA